MNTAAIQEIAPLVTGTLTAGEATTRPATAVRPLSLRRNFSWTLAGNITYAVCQAGILVVLAKLTSPEVVGQFAIALAIASPVVLFFNLTLRPVQATDASGSYQFGHYLALRLLTNLAALAVLACVAAIVGYPPAETRVILLVGLAKAFESLSDIIYGLLQQHERMQAVAVSLTIRGVLALLVMGLAIRLTASLEIAVLALALAWGSAFVLFDLPVAARMLGRWRSLRPTWDRRRISSLALLALPLGLSAMLISLNANLPKYLIEGSLGLGKLGVFAAMAYLLVPLTQVANALGQSASPRLAKYRSRGDTRAFWRLLFALVALAGGLGVVGALIAATAGGPLLRLVYAPEYAAEAGTFVVLMLGGAVLNAASILNYAAIAARKFVMQPLVMAAACTGNVAVCLLLLPRLGIAGAAWAIVVTSAIQLVGFAISISRTLAHPSQRADVPAEYEAH